MKYFFTGSLPGTMVSHQLIDAIKSKCTPEETLVLLKELPNPLADDTGMTFTLLFSSLFFKEKDGSFVMTLLCALMSV
jgi:hypothetical protein